MKAIIQTEITEDNWVWHFKSVSPYRRQELVDALKIVLSFKPIRDEFPHLRTVRAMGLLAIEETKRPK
jgi:hypothetical protein